MLKEKSDEDCMLAYQLGDENAFKELYTRHSGRVFGFLKSRLNDDSLARDVFQSTFLKLHRSRDRYNTSLPFVPWLFTICRSEMLDAIKKAKRLREDLVAKTPETTSSSFEEGRSLDLSSLTVSQKQAVDLRFNHDRSFEDIAKALGTSPSNARQLVSRAIKSLKGLYEKK